MFLSRILIPFIFGSAPSNADYVIIEERMTSIGPTGPIFYVMFIMPASYFTESNS